MSNRSYTFEVLTNVADLAAVAEDWETLARPFRNPLLGADWFQACAETLCREADLRVGIVRSSGSICAIAPLVVVRRDGMEWLEILGTSKLYEPTGFLYDSMASLEYLVAGLVGLGMPTLLTRIPKESPIGAVCDRIAKFKCIVVSKIAANSAYVDSTGKWDEYFRSISSQRRYDYQRKRKRLERAGQVTIRVESPASRSELSCLLEEVYRIEGSGWKGRAGSALIANESIRRFMARFSELACKRGSLRVCFLCVQGIAIATILGIEQEGRFWVLKIGYDEQWARCSPGIQITMETIRYAFENHLEAYEFLGSEEPWQAMWPRSQHHFVTVVLYPLSLKGLLAFGRHGLRILLSRATRKRAAAKSILGGLDIRSVKEKLSSNLPEGSYEQMRLAHGL